MGSPKLLRSIAACRQGRSELGCYDKRVDVGDSTLDDVRRAGERSAARWARRLGVSLLVVVVAVGAVGGFGVRSDTVNADGDGYTLSVTYPRIARAGLDAPWQVRVHHLGGFSSDLTLAISAHYFRMFETQGFFPDPDSATNDGSFVYLTFTKPRGDDFVLDYDAYLQPASQVGKSAVVKLLLEDTVVAQTDLRTWLVP